MRVLRDHYSFERTNKNSTTSVTLPNHVIECQLTQSGNYKNNSEYSIVLSYQITYIKSKVYYFSLFLLLNTTSIYKLTKLDSSYISYLGNSSIENRITFLFLVFILSVLQQSIIPSLFKYCCYLCKPCPILSRFFVGYFNSFPATLSLYLDILDVCR